MLTCVSECNCDPVGSATLQCNRRTGKCECVEGVAGDKCDRCDRGTTGQLPYCMPCGECFDNWDRIISELKSKYQNPPIWMIAYVKKKTYIE